MSVGAGTTDSGRSVRPFLQLLLVMALWGSAFAASKLAVHEVPSSVAAVLRFGCGAIALLLAVALLRQTLSRRVAVRDRIRASLAGILGVFGYNAFFFWALHLAPSIDGSIIVPVLSPILTTAIAVLIGREAPSRVRVLGLAIGLIGAVVFFLGIRDTGEVSGNRLLGDLVFVLGAACWATYTLITPRVLANIDPLRATTYATLFGAVLLGAWAIPDLGEVRWAELPSGFWPNIAYLAVGPTAVAYLLYYRGVRAVGPTNASIMMFAVPIFGAICSAVLLGESLSSVQAGGGAVMLVGAFLAATQGRLPGALTLRSLPRHRRPRSGEPGNVDVSTHIVTVGNRPTPGTHDGSPRWPACERLSRLQRRPARPSASVDDLVTAIFPVRKRRRMVRSRESISRMIRSICATLVVRFIRQDIRHAIPRLGDAGIPNAVGLARLRRSNWGGIR